MKFYINLKLIYSQEIPLNFLVGKVYQQMHLAIVDNKNRNQLTVSSLGLAFPNYDPKFNSLGDVVRIFSDEKIHLESLNIDKFLARLKDYIEVSEIIDVPKDINSHSCFYRIRNKHNLESLARRKSKRDNISLEDALKYFKNYKQLKIKEPYVNIKSLSSNNHFKLFVGKKDHKDEVLGSFDMYGLSSCTTTPNF